jgi:SRSO17 transposase
VKRLQFFPSESRRDAGQVNTRRLELLRADPATAPHGGGALVIDDSGDRKDGVKTAHVGRQSLGRYGKTDNGVVTVITVWVCERACYSVHVLPYTPAKRFAMGRTTRRSAPSWPSARAWRCRRGRRGSRSPWWSRTALTAIRMGSAPSWPGAGCRS